MCCFNMHRLNLSKHILHVDIQEFEMFLNLCCGLRRQTNTRSRSKARGGGYYYWYGSRRRWSWAELATSSLEGARHFLCAYHEPDLWVGSAFA